MALNTVSSDRLATNVKNTNFTSAEKQDLTNDILPLAGEIGSRNKLINGDMQISQRKGTTSVAYTNAQYTLDRWQVVNDAGGSKFTTQQVDDAPVGFKKSLKMTSSSAYSVPADEVYGVGQKIEGFNSNPLMFGSSDAKSITISFFVKSSLFGTFSGSVLNQDMTRGYPWTYTISAANQWEYKTVTVAGSTDGTWLHDHREGMRIFWNMGSGTNRSGTAGQWSTSQYTFGATGATSVVGTNGATLQITGCQVEEGTVATDFEHRSFDQQFKSCERYYEKSYDHLVIPGTANTDEGMVMWLANRNPGLPHVSLRFRTSKRTNPSITIFNTNTANSNTLRDKDAAADLAPQVNRIGEDGCTVYTNTSVALGNFIAYHYTSESEL